MILYRPNTDSKTDLDTSPSRACEISKSSSPQVMPQVSTKHRSSRARRRKRGHGNKQGEPQMPWQPTATAPYQVLGGSWGEDGATRACPTNAPPFSQPCRTFPTFSRQDQSWNMRLAWSLMGNRLRHDGNMSKKSHQRDLWPSISN